MDKIDIKVVRPFGPTYAHVKIPNRILDSLNDYIDNLIKDQNKKAKLNFGESLVGDVTQEFLIEKEIAEKSGWLNFLGTCIQKWIEIELNKKITKLDVIDTWVVRQFKNEYNPTHWHSGHISGAGFLKVPKTLGKYVQEKNKDYYGGALQLINGSRMFLSPSVEKIIPKVGDFYFFPHYLMHSVFPFKGTDEERRSISFNAKIDENIYNVYGD
tara:strand:- start:1002 stop:1640 length:639 start_codon:yes stop_codon:yes gene_type:complete